MAITEKQRLEIYDMLRDAHQYVHQAWKIYKDDITPTQENALDAASSVLYLAEGVFATPES